jgi:hypothetical protein
MRLPLSRPRGGHRHPFRAGAHPRVECLESRSLLSAAPAAPLTLTGARQPGSTVDAATALGDLSAVPAVRVDAAIGDSPAGAADVDWYAFTLDRPATVTLAAAGDAGTPSPVLTLYVRDPFDPGDPATIFGVRQLTQVDAGAPAAGTLLTRPLAAGTYYVAASGAGNRFFSPFLANSGYNGATGNYQLQLSATDLGLPPDAGPVVLASDPAAGSAPDRSPTVFRLDLSAPIDPTTVIPDDDVWLTYNPAGTFGDGNDQDVPLAAVHFSDAATELQLTPAAPLAPGHYRLQLAGDSDANFDVVAGPDGTPLGADDLHPSGQDFALTFSVVGVEGNAAPGAGADDTPAGAHDLGDVTDGRLVQAAGAIGDDPTDPVPFDPSDVDLYHFRLSGPGRYAFAAEVFAQRIDSPLNAAASLFALDPATGRLRLVTANDDTLNPSAASDNRSLPLFADPALFAGLTAGDYYLAVSSRKNVPDPDHGLVPGAGGVFDPAVSHSGRAGRSTGDYVLNLRVSPDDAPPHVVATTPGPGDSLAAPPTSLTVRFDGPVNLQQLAFRAYQQAQQGIMTSVYVQGPDGVQYYPRLQSFDPATSQATFLMLDRLPVGSYELHLSGRLGLADLAGNQLVGNDPGGDYVVPFTVSGTGVPAQAAPAGPQELGVLFPHDLQGPGFRITGGAGGYRFEVLQALDYFVFLDAPGGAGRRLTLTDDSGAPVVAKPQADGVSLQAFLQPGAYVLGVSGLAAGDAASLRVVLGRSSENPQPLTLGPAPVLRLTLAPPPPVVSPPVVVPPPVIVPPVVVPRGDGPPPSAPAPTGVPATAPPVNVLPPSPSAPAGGPVAAPVRATAPSAGVEVPSGLLAALGAGPVGGVSTGGGPAAAPRLSLGVSDAVATRDPARVRSETGAPPSGVVPVALEPLAESQIAVIEAAFPVVGHRSLIRAAVAAVARLIRVPRPWLEMFLSNAAIPASVEGSPGSPQAVLPPADEQGAPTVKGEAAGGAGTGPTAGLRTDATGVAACLAAAAVASGLAGERRGAGRATERQGPREGEREESREPGEPTTRI